MSKKNNEAEHANIAQSETPIAEVAIARTEAQTALDAAVKNWLGDDFVQSNMPRFAIGDGVEDRRSIQGIYIASQIEWHEDERDGVVKRRLLHQVRPPTATGPGHDQLIWGGYALDNELPCLPTGTRFVAAFVAMAKSKRGQFKRIDVLYPATTVKVKNPFFDDDDEPIDPRES